MLFKGISIFITSGGHFVWRSGNICAIFVESVIKNNPGPEVITVFFHTLNSAEHEIYLAHKC